MVYSWLNPFRTAQTFFGVNYLGLVWEYFCSAKKVGPLGT